MIGIICGLLGAIAYYCGVHATDNPTASFVFMALAAMFSSAILTVARRESIPMGFKGTAADSVYRFAHFIGNVVALTGPREEIQVTELPLYIAGKGGIQPATGIFLARLAGTASLVIESSLEEDSIDAKTEQQ